MTVYCVEHIESQKKYVGITTRTLNERWEEHIQKSQTNDRNHLHDALHLYGAESFKIYPLDSANTTRELAQKEQFWIKELDTYGNAGYNETLGGEGSFGRVMSEETKEKMRQSMIRRWADPAKRQQMSRKLKQYFTTDGAKEACAKHTKRGMQEWKESLTVKEYQKWLNNPKRGKHVVTADMKSRIAEFQSNRVRTPEEKLKLSQNRKGKGTGINNGMSRPEVRAKFSEMCKGRKKVTRPDGTWYWGRK